MRVIMHLVQILLVLLQSTSEIPALRNTRVVLPFVKEAHMLGISIVERDHGKGFVEVRYPSAVNRCTRCRLGWSDWMPRLLNPLRIIRIASNCDSCCVVQRSQRI
jgi:hypothetical protein